VNCFNESFLPSEKNESPSFLPQRNGKPKLFTSRESQSLLPSPLTAQAIEKQVQAFYFQAFEVFVESKLFTVQILKQIT